MTDPFADKLRVSMHKGDCASEVLNAIIAGRQNTRLDAFNSDAAYASIPRVCVHTTIVLLELLDAAYLALGIDDDGIRESIPKRAIDYLNDGRT